MSGSSSQAVVAPDPSYARPASDAQVDRAASQLREHGFEVVVVTTADEARREVLSRIPPGSEVLDATSRTLEEIGVVKALAENSGITLIKPRIRQLDRKTQADEIRRLTQSPALVVGSVHAITEDGQVLAASATGSQLGPYAYGAGRVIWVVGAQKIVPTLQDGIDRIERYALPLEDARARQAYGIGSAINRLLIVRREHQPGRTTLILVKQKLGF
jgi:L-lactate utilization protein LutC